jgi:hypothetical protein
MKMKCDTYVSYYLIGELVKTFQNRSNLKCVPKLGRTPVGESLEMAFQAE